MSSPTSSLIQCPNPNCLYADNPLGRRLCDRCQTPLTYRYLWAVGAGVEQISTGRRVDDRYSVISPGVWLDTKPGVSAIVPSELPDAALPYLHLYAHRLHVPEVYGFCQDEKSTAIMLLDNVPIDQAGQLYPTIGAVWGQVSPVRQLYWLWQILQLWVPLQSQGVVSSLLVARNLRVEGWRVRLQELYSDGQEAITDAKPDKATIAPSFRDLSTVWLGWIKSNQSAIAPQLEELCQRLQSTAPAETVWQNVSAHLNQLLLEQAAQMPLHLRVIGASATGPQRSHNEDACYPVLGTFKEQPSVNDPLLPHLAIVCDGIGGHAGGEVASQLALRSFQLQLRALLAEIAEQTEVVPPEVVIQQIEAIIRVVNNLIAAQNDEQGRELRQRMGTTLVLALQLPQKVATPNGVSNAHELYLAHIGDSRAYWITSRYCHLLTVDDDVASREVRLGRSLYREAQQRTDGGSLTQALGTRDGDTLQPTVQRFILEEEGILLLCSDGLSDNNLVEQFWENATRLFFKGKTSLELALRTWIDLANQHNGHDNTSVVLMHSQVSQDEPRVFEPTTEPAAAITPDSQLSEASRALLYDEEPQDEDAAVDEIPQEPRSPNLAALAFGLFILLLVVGGAGLVAWRTLDPTSFGQTWERILQPSQPQQESSPNP